MKLYPLKFGPVPVEREWGGTALFDKLGKTFKVKDEDGNECMLSPETPVGESYEVADLGECGESIAANGFLAGNTLEEITETYMEDLIGDNPSQYFGTQFPLLVKTVDIQGSLPVHVHPDDRTAFERYDALGKKEFWYIMEADRDAAIYIGFNRDLSATELFDRCLDGTIKESMHRIRPEKGDMTEIPAGMAHCAEGKILAGIIEEPSLIAFNLYDGKGTAEERIAHIGESMDFIRLERTNPADCISRKEGIVSDTDESTIECIRLAPEGTRSTGLEEEDSVSVFLCTEGDAGFTMEPYSDSAACRVKKGEAVVIPAAATALTVKAGKQGCTLISAKHREREEHDSYTEQG